MKKSNLNKITGAMIAAAAVTAACLLSSSSVQAAELPNAAEVTGTEYTGMATDKAGKQYWYEEGVRQGTEGRGKEIYDPDTDAWYWLDAVQNGAVATSKDVYQESSGGKWVRYDENGRMVKGWDENENGKYYFDPITGAMTKGAAIIEGAECAFDDNTGVAVDCSWYSINGNEYWYENGVRQGLEGRGKEIYDPASDAWYWLDSIDGGKKATSKDVYQESSGGKWVRYDENGAMVKGWNELNGNIYYFDPVTGAMAKGEAEIEGVKYTFDMATGIMQIFESGTHMETKYVYYYDLDGNLYYTDSITYLAYEDGQPVETIYYTGDNLDHFPPDTPEQVIIGWKLESEEMFNWNLDISTHPGDITMIPWWI